TNSVALPESYDTQRHFYTIPTRRSSDLLEFVSERRALLADAANNFLNTLYNSDAAGIINVAEYTVEEGVLSEEDEIILKLSHLPDRKSTRLNSSHVSISYAVFCLQKKK